MVIHPLTWIISVAVILGVICTDFLLHVRRPHAPSLRESATWISIYVGLSLLFGVGLGLIGGWDIGGQFFAGYLTEESLSLDNLFVFLLLIASFRVPKEAEQKVLLIGITMALVLRAVFILLGAAIIERFSAVFYLFGAFLIYTAVKLIVQHQSNQAHATAPTTESRLVRLMRRVLPVSRDFISDRVFVQDAGRRLVTPLLLVIIAIGSVDLLFAMDSIPAIFGLTKEPYIVFMANACALMGLRQLYFLIGGLLEKLTYLSAGLSFILAFIGVKLILEALATNELPFINGGQPVSVWHISTIVSLLVIVVTMLVVVIASRLKARPDPPS